MFLRANAARFMARFLYGFTLKNSLIKHGTELAIVHTKRAFFNPFTVKKQQRQKAKSYGEMRCISPIFFVLLYFSTVIRSLP